MIEEHYETVGGYRIRYLEAREGPQARAGRVWREGPQARAGRVHREGPPLVLLHGLGNSCVVFRPNMEELAQGFRVLAPDLPGHGRSENAPDGRYDAVAGTRFLAAFLKEVAGEPAHLLGVSAGGLLAGLAAYYYPQRVRRLALVDSAGLGRELHWSLKLPAVPGLGRLLIPGSRRSLRALLGTILYDTSHIDDGLVEELYQVARGDRGHQEALYRAFRAGVGPLGLLGWQAYRRRLLSLRLPVLIVWGAQDRLIPVAHAQRAAREMANARLHVFGRCGHWPFYERAQEFNGLLLSFLREDQPELGG